MGVLTSYRLRLRRKRFRLRALRRSRDLRNVQIRTGLIQPSDILLFATIRNEKPRLPGFLAYYRDLGVSHFLIVDNGSDDGSQEFLARQDDVSVWSARGSYRRSRYGMDWMNWLLSRYGHGHWTLTVDADEYLVYPHAETRPLPALTHWLDAAGIRSFGTMLLDLYPGPEGKSAGEAHPTLGDCQWFDPWNYTINRNHLYDNLWIQGGPRARAYFADEPSRAPALNKVPLVKWHRRYAYASSTHALLPRGLNRVYDEWGGEKATGCLLHPKFDTDFQRKAEAEARRREHYGAAREYVAYAGGKPQLATPESRRFEGWRQLDALGLMSAGNWA